jgi:hypothetical protein
MGPVNWVAVILGAIFALVLGMVWYNPVFRGPRPVPDPTMQGGKGLYYGRSFAALLIVSTMIGHNFARIGAEALAAKPWLYWMMSGGLGLTIAAPALLTALGRHGIPLRERLVDCGYWIVAMLAMGTTFWALR